MKNASFQFTLIVKVIVGIIFTNGLFHKPEFSTFLQIIVELVHGEPFIGFRYRIDSH